MRIIGDCVRMIWGILECNNMSIIGSGLAITYKTSIADQMAADSW